MATRSAGERAVVVIAAAAEAGDRITARLVDEAYRAGVGLDLVFRARSPPIAIGGVAVALAGVVDHDVVGRGEARIGVPRIEEIPTAMDDVVSEDNSSRIAQARAAPSLHDAVPGKQHGVVADHVPERLLRVVHERVP